MRHAVIMAGGTGTRLWPMSRQATPKQFQKLIGERTLLQQTYDRAAALLKPEQIWIMTGDQYAETVAEQLPELPTQNIITEPAARNTAAASGLAVLRILQTDPEAVIALLASDHYVGKKKSFLQAVNTAYSFVEKHANYVMAVGIHPTSPNTGYGYIQLGQKIATLNRQAIYRADSFKEKPDQTTAEEYLESGQYLWNASYFVFNGAYMAAAYDRLAPELAKKLKNYLTSRVGAEYETIDKTQNLDQVIIEHLNDLAVLPAEMQWSDIGDWAALHEILAEHQKSSAVAVGEHIGNNTENTLVMGGNKLIATVGVKDIVVIDTDDVILICDRNSAQDVKKIVEALQEKGDKTYL